MARYTDGLLMDGEHVVYRTRQHPFGRLFDAKIGILAVGLGLATLIVIALSNMQGGTLRDVLGWVVLVLIVGGAAKIAWVYLRWYQDDYVVTNRRVIKVEGILNKKAADSGLEKINDAILEQSVFGRMFDWGNLRILTAAEEVADDYHLLHHAPTFKKTMLLAKQDIEDELARRITAPLDALNARELEEDRREAQARASARPVVPPPPVPAQKTTEEKLRELAGLRDAGLITPEDYEAKKTTILATM